MLDPATPYFRLRIPPDLKRRIADKAKAARRSVSAEMLVALEAAFPAAGGDQT